MPTVFTVTNTADAGVGSLRDAITQANNEVANPGADTIQFAAGLFGQTISLSTVGDSTFGPTALTVTSTITIDGLIGYTSGAGVTISRAAAVSNLRLFYVTGTGNLTLQGLALSGGAAVGGNGGSGSGGGGGGAGMGGAVFNQGTLAVTQSTLANNTATGGNGGDGTGVTSGDGGSGGGPNGGAAGVGTGGAGGAGGFGGGGGGGAGDASYGGVGGNGGFGGGGGSRGAYGAGVGGSGVNGFGGGGPGSYFAGAGGGGAGMGGAIFNHGGTVTITNSTLAGNTATGGIGGVANANPAAPSGQSLGGGVFSRNGSVTILNSTLSGNTAAQGGRGVYVVGDAAAAGYTLNNALIGQSDTAVTDVVANTINGGTATGAGTNNLIRANTGVAGLTGTVTADPTLLALASNGGPTQTMAISNTSPAFNAGSNAAASGLTIDQRGTVFARIDGGTVDIGSYEVDIPPAVTIATGPANGTYGSGRNLDFTLTFGKVVTVTGTPRIQLTVGAATVYATYLSGTGTSALTFRYTVQPGDTAPAGIASASPVQLNGGTIQDAAASNAVLTFTPPTTGGVLVDAVAPTVSSVTGPANGSYRAGQNLDFTVTFSKSVAVAGAPRIALAVGSSTVYAVYLSGSGTNTLTFRYTVQPGDAAPAGITSSSPIQLNGGTIQDAAANSAVLTFTPPTTTGVLVDTTAPTVGVALDAGQSPSSSQTSVRFAVTFSKPVTGFTAAGVTVGGTAEASLVSVSGSGSSYVVTVSGLTRDGTVNVTVTAAAASDAAGNASAASGVSPDVRHTTLPTTVLASTAGTGPNGTQVQLLDPGTGKLTRAIDPFPGFTGNVSTASVDLNGDGVADVVVGAGAGGAPHVKVFDGATGKELFSFFAFDPVFRGGVTVAVGDVTGDGIPDIIVGAGAGGGPAVGVFDGKTGQLVRSFFAYDPAFTGGVNVAAGDVNGDGVADIVTAPAAGGAPHVEVFDGKTGNRLQSFFAYDPQFVGGVNVAVGDINGDGFADIITGAGAGGGPHVKVFDGKTGAVRGNFFAYDAGFVGGADVAAVDANGDGLADIVTGAGPGGAPHVKVFNGLTFAEMDSFLDGTAGFLGGVRVS